MSLKIGVLGIQGAIEEHVASTRRALKEERVEGEVIVVKRPDGVERVHGLIIPGGESTVMGYLSLLSGLFSSIKGRAMQGMPNIVTCAGLIILSKRVYDRVVGEVKQPLLGLLDVTVERNTFGRQRESFETPLKIEGIEGGDFPGVFIRAPSVKEVGERVRIICKLDDEIVGVKQESIVGLAFHPELTDDLRVHKYFLRLVRNAIK
ncbi:MAG: pyridoxal 5'-phosphate synthase glutaminase subunit PdxT [Nitrososphaerota archaeon]